VVSVAEATAHTIAANTYINWLTDMCKGAYKRGDKCPSGYDSDCAGSLECGKRSSDSTYICCDDTYRSWFTDYRY
jgi:hypothetical protein